MDISKANIRNLKKKSKAGLISKEEFDRLTKLHTIKQSDQKENMVQSFEKVINTNSPDIKIKQVTIAPRGIPLLIDTDVTINQNRKYGLIGLNGSGKSTLLEQLASRQLPVQDCVDMLYVRQEMEGSDKTPIECVIESDTERTKLLLEERILKKKLDDDFDNEAQDRLLVVYDKLKSIGAYTANTRAKNILFGLQFTEEMQHKPTNELSGGWRMRVALACALFVQPKLLLLDEPTNHLDLNASIWLEAYLAKYNKTLILVSHDRDFLNNIVTDIIHLNNKKLTYYKGNYDSFVKNSNINKKQEEKLFKKTGQKINKDKTVQFIFRNPDKLKIPVIQIKQVDFSYDDYLIFNNLELNIDCNSKIAIIGPNGSGKTTLIKLITKELNPTNGEIYHNNNLRIAKFSQHFVDQLDMDISPVEYINSKFKELKTQEIRNSLGMFGIHGTTQEQQISLLSGGQKSRVCLCEISLTMPHILFLDEPTNHLDIASVDALADALIQFKGGIVFITHDQRLVSQVASELWVCGNNKVIRYEGTFDDYKQEIINDLFIE